MQNSKRKLTKIITVVFAVTGLVAYVIYSQANGTIRIISGTKSNACINNLRQIDGAKDQWAVENNKHTGEGSFGKTLTVNATQSKN